MRHAAPETANETGIGVVSDPEQIDDFPHQHTLSATGGSFELSVARPDGAGTWTVRVGWFQDAGAGAEVSCLVDKELEPLAPGRVHPFTPTADRAVIVGGTPTADGKIVLGWDSAG
jgi:hypothetical protein